MFPFDNGVLQYLCVIDVNNYCIFVNNVFMPRVLPLRNWANKFLVLLKSCPSLESIANRVDNCRLFEVSEYFWLLIGVKKCYNVRGSFLDPELGWGVEFGKGNHKILECWNTCIIRHKEGNWLSEATSSPQSYPCKVMVCKINLAKLRTVPLEGDCALDSFQFCFLSYFVLERLPWRCALIWFFDVQTT